MTQSRARAAGRERHQAREAALQILYLSEVGGVPVDEAADTFFGHQWAEPRPAGAELQRFARDLAALTLGALGEIDRLIADQSEHWRPERMAVVDRLILRLAVGELRRGSGTPAGVVMNEALELARTFSGEEAVKFINGLLDGIRRRLDDEAQAGPPAAAPDGHDG